MAKPGKNTEKVFAVASTIGAVLRSHNTGEPKITMLAMQIGKAMRVFNVKAGRVKYWYISNEVSTMWQELLRENDNKIEEDDVPAFIEYLCMMVPPNHFKTFLGLSPYTTEHRANKENDAMMTNSVLALDKKLNEFLGTKSYGLIKPIERVTKVKKKRDKSETKVKSEKISSAKLKRSADRKRKKESLKEMIARAKAKKES